MWGSAAHWAAWSRPSSRWRFLGPLIVLLTKGNESPGSGGNAVESLNFQLSILIYGLVSLRRCCFVLVGFVLLPDRRSALAGLHDHRRRSRPPTARSTATR